MSNARQFTAVIEHEGDLFVALCPELDIASQGATVEEAHSNLVEAIELFFETASKEEMRRGYQTRFVTDSPELTARQFSRAISARVRKRLMQGRFESGSDVVALRRFVGLSQARFARAIGISVHTLRNWEQGRRHPDGPAIALLRIAARHPRIIRESLESAA